MRSTSSFICSMSASTPGEALLVAEELHELDLGLLAVEVAVEVEQVGLEQRLLGVLVERGPPPDVDGARVPLAGGHPGVPPGVDAVGRPGHPLGHGDVGGGEPELPAPLVAAGHRAA